MLSIVNKKPASITSFKEIKQKYMKKNTHTPTNWTTDIDRYSCGLLLGSHSHELISFGDFAFYLFNILNGQKVSFFKAISYDWMTQTKYKLCVKSMWWQSGWESNARFFCARTPQTTNKTDFFLNTASHRHTDAWKHTDTFNRPLILNKCILIRINKLKTILKVK